MAKLKAGDKVFFRQGLEKYDTREFTVTSTVSESGVDYVYVQEFPDGIFEEKFFDLTRSPDHGIAPPINTQPPAPVDAGPNEKFYSEMDQLITAAIAAWTANLDAEAIVLLTQALEILRNNKEIARGAKS